MKPVESIDESYTELAQKILTLIAVMGKFFQQFLPRSQSKTQ